MRAEEALPHIVRIVQDIVFDGRPEPIDASADLFELGLTSLASVQILVAVEEAFDLVIPDELLTRDLLGHVSALADVVATVSSGSG